VEIFAQHYDVPQVPFKRDPRKDDGAATYLADFDTAVTWASKLHESRLLVVSLTENLVEVHQPHACR
jgi:hypothetical protein